ncbi:MAG: NADH-quinone oxidoreductase subunit C, partial [Patescibacteria group bacterium]
MTEYATLFSQYGLDRYAPTRQGNAYVFRVPEADLQSVILTLKNDHSLPLKTVAATDNRIEEGVFRIHYVFGVPKENIFLIPFISVSKDESAFTSLTPFDQEFSVYEQEIFSFFGLVPKGHPNAKRIILHQENYTENVYPLRKDFAWNTKVEMPEERAEPEFQKFGGEGVYEIPVGPVHAGIIEPGHFRFSVLGEEILRLEPRLGYVHKGTEKLFENLPLEKKLKLSERISGDSSFHHALAFCQALEAMSGTQVPERAKLLRTLYAELERLANHFNDLGFMMLDTGFSFGGSHGTRLRERIMQWNEKLSGHRFLRGVVVPGGVTANVDRETVNELHEDLEVLEGDFREVIEVAMTSTSVLNRLRGAGTLDVQIGKDHGALGVALRACGVAIDARADYPYAGYDMLQFSIPTEETGDVYARFRVRVREVHQSFRILNQALTLLTQQGGEIMNTPGALPVNAYGVGITEGFRGDI